MSENENKLEGKLIESLEAKELGNLTVDYAELGLDSIFDDGIVKDIPFLRTFVSLFKIGVNVRDRIYIKKIYGFLVQVGQTTQEQREKFIEDNCKNTKQFEEAVLLILEQADNMNKSALIGKIFKACILKMISYQDALSLSSIVNKALWQDLENTLKSDLSSLTAEMKMRLCNCGLLNLSLMKRVHHGEQREPTETIDGFGYLENQYFKILVDVAKL